MIKIVNNKKHKRHPEIGETFLYTHEGVEHLVVRHFSGCISLTDPNITWSNCVFYGDLAKICLVDIEIRVL